MIQINWVNTGLDDRIIKSMNPAIPKVKKEILVHGKTGDYYALKPVNVEQLPVNTTSHKDSHQELFDQAAKLGIQAEDLKAAEFVHGALTKPTERTKAISASRGFPTVDLNGNHPNKCSLKSVDAATFTKLKKMIEKDFDESSPSSLKFSDWYKINGIYEISGLAGEHSFQQIKAQNAKYKNETAGCGKNCQSDLFYHGTSYNAVLNILGKTGGFNAKGSVAQGTNATSDVFYSLGYAIGRYDPTDFNGPLLICEGSLGKHSADNPHSSSYKNSKSLEEDENIGAFDGGELKDYFVFRKENSLIPRYVVDVEDHKAASEYKQWLAQRGR